MTSSRSRAFAIVAGGLGLFLVCFLLFALQARSARQRAMAAVPVAVAPHRVLQRRVVVRTIVVHLRPAGGDEGGRAIPVRVSVPAAAPAPVSTAPVAPAPAAAPPPLVTRTS